MGGRYRTRAAARAAEASSSSVDPVATTPTDKNHDGSSSSSDGDALLTPFLSELGNVFETEVLPLLSEMDLAMLMRVGRDARKTVVASGLPRAGATEETPLIVRDFCRSVALLAWAKAQGAPWNEKTLAYCALAGGMEVVLWARKQRGGIPWDHRAIGFAAAGGRLDVMEYLRAGGCPWHETCTLHAVLNNQLEAFTWLMSLDCPWDPKKTAIAAAEYGSLDLMRCVREQPDSDWSADVFAEAARKAKFDMLEYLLENNAPRDFKTFNAVAANGDMRVLKWLKRNNFPYSAVAAANAAKFGHLHVLEWLRENSCPMNEKACALAAGMGHLDILIGLVESGRHPMEREERFDGGIRRSDGSADVDVKQRLSVGRDFRSYGEGLGGAQVASFA